MKNRCKFNPCCGDPYRCTGSDEAAAVSEILPCPFCGGAPDYHEAMRRMMCTGCTAMIDVSIHPAIFQTWQAQRRAEKEKAVELWNRRSPPPVEREATHEKR